MALGATSSIAQDAGWNNCPWSPAETPEDIRRHSDCGALETLLERSLQHAPP